MKQVGEIFLGHIAAEFNLRIVHALLPYVVRVSLRLRMISAGNNQLYVRHSFGKQRKSFNHQLQPLIGSPLAEGENAVGRIPAPREIGKFRPPRQNAVGAQVNIVAAVLVIQDLAIAGHED